MKLHRERSVIASLLLCSCLVCGCSGKSATKPAYTPAEQKEMFRKEVSGEVKSLIEMEKKYGMNHSQVRQKKIELGMDPDKPAADQQP